MLWRNNSGVYHLLLNGPRASPELLYSWNLEMALSLPPGITPPEVAFLCEMELVTIIPRQRLEGLRLLGVSTASITAR